MSLMRAGGVHITLYAHPGTLMVNCYKDTQQTLNARVQCVLTAQHIWWVHKQQAASLVNLSGENTNTTDIQISQKQLSFSAFPFLCVNSKEPNEKTSPPPSL